MKDLEREIMLGKISQIYNDRFLPYLKEMGSVTMFWFDLLEKFATIDQLKKIHSLLFKNVKKLPHVNSDVVHERDASKLDAQGTLKKQVEEYSSMVKYDDFVRSVWIAISNNADIKTVIQISKDFAMRTKDKKRIN